MKRILYLFFILLPCFSFSQQLIGTSGNIDSIPGSLRVGSTGGSTLGGGNTSQRIFNYAGGIRWNSDSLRYEVFTGLAWRGLLYNGEGGSGSGNYFDSLRNNSGTLEGRKSGIFVPQFVLPSGGSGAAIGNVVTGGKKGSVLFLGNGGALQQDSVNFRWDSTNKRLGIGGVPLNALYVYTTNSTDGISLDGTSAPSISLRIAGVIKGYAPAIVTSANSFFAGTVAGDLAFRSEANKIFLGTGLSASPQLVISNTGVGMGNASPTSWLHLRGGGTAAGTSPIKFTYTGNILTTPEAGAMEYDGTNFYLTNGIPRRGTINLTVASNDLTAQTAPGTVVTLTPITSTYEVGGYVNVQSISTDVLQMQITYHDENNQPQTFSFPTISAPSATSYSPIIIRVLAGNPITLKTINSTGGGTETFDAGGFIRKSY